MGKTGLTVSVRDAKASMEKKRLEISLCALFGTQGFNFLLGVRFL